MAANDDFASFIERIRGGDQDAATELFERYEQELRIIARVRLRDPRMRRVLDSVDACQSTFRNFFAQDAINAFRLETPNDLMSLLAVMLKNKVKDYARYHRAGKRDIRRCDAQGPEEHSVADSYSNYFATLENEELANKCKALLSDDVLRIHNLREEQGLDWELIARLLGESVGAIRKRYERALKRVKAKFELKERSAV